MNNFHEILINQLAKESNFVTDDGELKKFIIIDAAFNMNRKLIELLLEIPEIKQKFFIEISAHWVFDINLFVQYMENKNFLKDSYTRYRNKIGLNIGGKFMNQRNEVSLVWPFKDCILEGGQSREDQKRPEIFFNEILAQQEIDQLTEPKVLTNWKRYTVDGEKPVNELKRENGTIKENLIIKGNNLLALHSLLPQFEEKVKLIYIDPPYNTGGDSFKYNDSFNHSTWLTFMKNRLELARKLLCKDGSIFIQIDDFEAAYLKVLLDEIFGRDNFRNQITWKRRGGSANPSNRLNNVTDYILWFSKTLNFKYIPIFSIDDDNTKDYILERFTNELNGRKYMLAPIERNAKLGLRETLRYEYNGYIPQWGWMVSKEKLIEFDRNNRLHWNSQNKPNRRVFIDEYQGQPISSLWTDIKVINPMSNERNEFESGQKPEALLKRIIEFVTDKNDIVLDFHLGSGTTAAVAHKINRQYIGIEQMDYIQSVTVDRINKVIGKMEKPNGELHEKLVFDEGGISKAVNWQGGGEFVYCELKKYNQTFIEQIEEAETTDKLLEIWGEMKVHSFLNYNVDIKKHDESVGEFKQLSIETQKQHLCEILNKNQLYVNLSSIDDEDYKVSDDDKHLTCEFYEIKKVQEEVQTKLGL